MASLQDYNKRYTTGYVYCDPTSGFELNMAGFFAFDLERSLDKALWSKALATVEATEQGQVVNRTAHPHESENRAVDHYNLRMAEERVPGKSLGHSIKLWQTIQDELSRARSNFDSVIINGIGGSYLGPLMTLIFEVGERFNSLEAAGRPKFYFSANCDPAGMVRLQQNLDPGKTLSVHISKSGSTAETKGNLEALYAWYKNAGLKPGSQMCAVTTPGSMLDDFASDENFLNTFYMHPETGGRTSVGSAVGMVPAALAGLDFEAFLKGMSHMDELTRIVDAEKNPAAWLSLGIYHKILNQGPKNMVMLGYKDSLREYAHYCQQLFMESLGKNYDLEARPVKTGLSCFGGVGTGEQHAFMQQIQKGIDDSFVRFYSFRRRQADFPNQKNISMGNLLNAFVRGTQTALVQNGVDFAAQVHHNEDLHSLGMMVALEERMVSLLAAFWNINPYDQPGVQDGKKAAAGYIDVYRSVGAALAEAKGEKTFSGNARQFCKQAGLPETATADVDDILSDVAVNGQVHSAHPINSVKVSRQWADKGWVYTTG